METLVPATNLQCNPAAVYLASLGEGSRRVQGSALRTIAGLVTGQEVTLAGAIAFPWAGVRYQHAQAIRAKLGGSVATANRNLAALRGVLKECFRLGLMPAEEYHRAVDLKPIRGETLQAGRRIASGEIRALFMACSRDLRPTGRRDAALLAVLLGAGLRRSEAVALDLADIGLGVEAVITVRHGKGNKAREVQVNDGIVDALRDWIQVRGSEPGPLLCPVDKAGHVVVRRMTSQAVLYRLRDLAAAAGTKTFSPHDCRRTFITDLLDAGADIATVQKLAGHSKIDTTARYDRRGDAAKRKATALLHIPYVPPVS